MFLEADVPHSLDANGANGRLDCEMDGILEVDLWVSIGASGHQNRRGRMKYSYLIWSNTCDVNS